jgi:hypothetical protein
MAVCVVVICLALPCYNPVWLCVLWQVVWLFESRLPTKGDNKADGGDASGNGLSDSGCGGASSSLNTPCTPKGVGARSVCLFILVLFLVLENRCAFHRFPCTYSEVHEREKCFSIVCATCDF